MGNWVKGWWLEVGKMALYLTIPVAAFHVFNSPQYFEKYVIEKKREMYPHEDELFREEVNQLLHDMNSGNLASKIRQYIKMQDDRKETRTATPVVN